MAPVLICPSCQAQYDEVGTRFCGRCGSNMRRAQAGRDERDPMLGRVIDSRYRVLSKLGQGGMGAVYKVEHLAMGKQAAMKILHPAHSDDPQLGARFRREAEAVSRLSHPNTVQVFDFAATKNLMYLVMELVRGEDLGAVLRRDGPLSFSRVRLILMQVCEALAEAHELGIVHRDLKPENLLITRARDGRDVVKVLDFGLAKLRDAEEASHVTARGSLVGTPAYMSPEQIRAEDLDARSDIYSLGAVLYRVVTGEPPYSAPTPVAVLTQHLTEKLVPPTRRRPDLNIDPIVDQIVAKAMAKEPSERYQTADDLRRALEHAPHVSQPIAAVELQARRASDRTDETGRSPGAPVMRREDLDAYERALRRRRWLGALAVPLLIVSGVGAFAFMKYRDQPKPLHEESEPNNTPAQANFIGNHQTVRGHVGKCLGPTESDRDYFHVRVEPDTVLKVNLTGLPTMDLKLQVYDSDGRRLAESDQLGVSDGEDLPNLRLEAGGDYYIAVREVWVHGRPATEDEINWYTLTASWYPRTDAQESEPNDTPAQALPLWLERPVRGYAGRGGDVDYYVLRGEGGGTLEGTLSEIDGVDLRLVVLPAGSTSGPPGPLPAGAKVFDQGGPGEPEKLEGVSWPAGAAGPIIVVERKDGPPDANGHWRELVGLSNAYSLSVRLTR